MKKSVLLPMLPLVLLVSLLATGCSTYSPVCVDIPLIQHKGDLQMEGAFFVNDPVGVRAAIAYGITDHWAAAVSVDPFPSRNYSQAMMGAYFPVGDRFVWELYCGMGYGECRGLTYYKEDGYYASGRHRLNFMQVDAGWQNLTNFLNLDIAFSLKTGYMFRRLNVGDGWISITDSVSGNTNYYESSHTAKEHCLLVEPTVEVRFGWPNFKFNVKAGYAHIFGTKEGRYNSFAIGLGMSYRFDTRK